MQKQKPLYVMHLRPALPSEPPAKNRVIEVRRGQIFHNEIPGAEWRSVYDRN